MPRAWLLKLALAVLPAALLGQSPAPPPQAQSLALPAPPAAQPASVIVLDPGHGGTDAGARGPSGVLEKDVVLVLARILRAELERNGHAVVLTREANDNPSFDDRAARANAQRRPIFISLHISSTGTVGTARAYYFGGPRLALPTPPAAAPAALRWDEAQYAHVAASRRLAELLQVQLGLKFRGSPEIPAPAPVRQLRSVAAPAVAIEISSVVVADAKRLTDLGPPLAAAVVRAMEAFRAAPGGGL